VGPGVPGSLVGVAYHHVGHRERTVVVNVLLAAGGLALLAYAADHLVVGAARLAQRLRIRPVVVGVVVIGLGTSAPEFLVSGLAATRGNTGLAVGNIVGSNIVNLSLLLGIAAVVAPIPAPSTVIRREAPLAIGAVVLFGLAAVTGLDARSAAVLVVAGAAAVWLLVRWSADGRSAPVEVGRPPSPHRRGWAEPVRAVLGLAGVLVGAQMLVDGASAIAGGLGVPQVVIGGTVVALGTSLPELVTSVQAQRRGESDLVVGNLFGSNLFNSLIGGAVIGFADRAGAARSGIVLVLAMVGGAGLAWLLLRRGGRLTRGEGIGLVLAYAAMTPLLLIT
jgi:cation:H+ antiporter